MDWVWFQRYFKFNTKMTTTKSAQNISR